MASATLYCVVFVHLISWDTKHESYITTYPDYRMSFIMIRSRLWSQYLVTCVGRIHIMAYSTMGFHSTWTTVSIYSVYQKRFKARLRSRWHEWCPIVVCLLISLFQKTNFEICQRSGQSAYMYSLREFYKRMHLYCLKTTNCETCPDLLAVFKPHLKL